MNIINITNLVRAYFIESKKRLLLACFITFGIVAFGFTVTNEPDGLLSFPYYVLFFLASFTIFGFKKNRAQFFILPSSTAEKFSYAIVTTFITGIALYLVSLAGAYIGHYLISPLIPFGKSSYLLNEVNILRASVWSWRDYLDLATFISVFLFGSIYFKTNAFIKTVGIGIGFLFAIALYFIALLYITFGGMAFNDSISINIANYSFLQTYDYVLTAFIAVFFLSLTYLRLRETEV